MSYWLRLSYTWNSLNYGQIRLTCLHVTTQFRLFILPCDLLHCATVTSQINCHVVWIGWQQGCTHVGRIRLLSYEVALRININIRTTRKSTRKPLRTLSKFASEFFQTYFSGKRRHSVLFGTTLADTLSPSWSTHAWNLPENSWTPRMLNISQKRSETTRTLPIPGMAANNALMTTWVC